MRKYLSDCKNCFTVNMALARVLIELLKLALEISSAARKTTPAMELTTVTGSGPTNRPVSG